MEGGASASILQLSNIGDFKEIGDLYAVGNASFFTTILLIVVARIGNVGGPSLNGYFSSFGLEAILSNSTLLVLVLQTTRWFYTTFYDRFGRDWSPFVFIAFGLLVLCLHDIAFFYGVINTLPNGKNDMIDALKDYVSENKIAALGIHSALLVLTGIVAMIMKDMSDAQLLLIFIVGLYLTPYILSIVSKKVVVPLPVPVTPPPKVDSFRDNRSSGFY